MSRGFLRTVGLLSAGFTLWLAPGAAAQEAPPADRRSSAPDEVTLVRQELETLRRDHESRLAALEARLAALEAQGETRPADEPVPATASVAASAAPVATPAQPAGGDGATAALPVYGSATASSKVFNPDIGVIGDFVAAAGRSPGGGEPSLSMREAELSFRAVVDPYASADFYVSLGPDEVALEEGYVRLPTLPGGLLAKVGRIRSAFGKANLEHNHVLAFVDRPLATRNLLGGEEPLADSGLSLSRLVPNPWLFVEATGQVFRGESGVFSSPDRADLAWGGNLRAYRDLGESTNLELGGSIAYGRNGAGADTATRLLGVDLTLRYRPLRRSIYTRLMARGELMWSRRQDLQASPTVAGGYGQLEYQFARRLSAGVRYDRSRRAGEPDLLDRGGSFVLTFRPSEFSQLRAQLRRTRFGEGRTENELLFQLLFAIGAHGAHPF